MKFILNRLGIHNKEDFLKFTLSVFKFGCVGALNAAISILIFNTIVGTWPEQYLLANAAAWFITVFIAYELNRRFVFNSTKEGYFPALIKCYLAYLGGLIVSSLLLIVWVEFFSIDKTIAQLINIIIMVPANYLLGRFWTFKL